MTAPVMYRSLGGPSTWTTFTRSAFLSACEHDRTHDGDEDQHRRYLEGQQESAEEQAADVTRATDEITQVGGAGVAREYVRQPPCDHYDGGHSQQQRDAAAARDFFLARIQ